MQMNRKREMQERKYFGCGGFRHIARNCKTRKKKEVVTQQSSNRFEVLMDRVINREVPNRREVMKEENTEEGELLREVTVKIVLERIDVQEGITVKVLLDSRVTGLMMSLKFVRKKRFKLKKIERPIYMRNMDGMFNKEGLV